MGAALSVVFDDPGEVLDSTWTAIVPAKAVRGVRWTGVRPLFTSSCVCVLVALALSACGSRSAVRPIPPPRPLPQLEIMGAARLSAAQIVDWVHTRQPRTSGTYAATVPIETLVQMFLEEGAAEGVTGDIAFVQSVIETGWFRFMGTVPPSFNNFGGIGAMDRQPAAAAFTDARTGVRAQMQHLRAYADASANRCASPPLANPCVDPRFHLVLPKGKARHWNQLGNGNWASDRRYGTSIVMLFQDALRFSERSAGY